MQWRVPDDATSAGERAQESQEKIHADGFSEQELETFGPADLRSLLWLGQETGHSGISMIYAANRGRFKARIFHDV